MIYLGSLPRCGSTYLFRSIAALPQGGNTPEGAQEEHGIIKTHLPPDSDPRISWTPGDSALFLFGDVAASVVSTQLHRHDPGHWRNCGVEDYDPDADLLDRDVLGYADLFDAWYFAAPFPVLFVKYEHLAYSGTRHNVERWLGREIEWLPWRRRRTLPTREERTRVSEAYYRLCAGVRAASIWPGTFVVGPGARVRWRGGP